MKILVAGATGKIGHYLITELRSRGHRPIAMVRESSNTSRLPSAVQLREADLIDLPDDVCDGCDAVVFAAGSGSYTDNEHADKVDRQGAMRLIDLAAEANISRFVMLSSFGADTPPSEGAMSSYLQAKHDADQHLMQSDLQYSIVRPVSLVDNEGKRSIVLGDEVDQDDKAARGDVAAVLARAIDEYQWLGQAVAMASKQNN